MNNCYILDVFNVIIVRDFPDLILRIKREEIELIWTLNFKSLLCEAHKGNQDMREALTSFCQGIKLPTKIHKVDLWRYQIPNKRNQISK